MAKTKTAVKQDLRTLLDDARALFSEAGSQTGDKADDIRRKAQDLLDEALESAEGMQEVALVKGRQAAMRTDAYVHDNPWKVIAVTAGIGVLAGWILGRK